MKRFRILSGTYRGRIATHSHYLQRTAKIIICMSALYLQNNPLRTHEDLGIGKDYIHPVTRLRMSASAYALTLPDGCLTQTTLSFRRITASLCMMQRRMMQMNVKRKQMEKRRRVITMLVFHNTCCAQNRRLGFLHCTFPYKMPNIFHLHILSGCDQCVCDHTV